MTLTTTLRALASLAAFAVAVAVSPPPPSAQPTSPATARQAKVVIAVQPTSTPEQLTADAKELREVVIGQQKKAETFYFSYWVVAKDSPVERLEQLRGKRAVFPSPLSTSGYVAPLARLVELGLVPRQPGKEADPKAFFGDVRFAGGYAQGWEALKAKQADVTVIAGDVSEKLYRDVLAGTKVIEQQGPIPSHAVLFARDLDQAAKTQLRDALLDLGKPEHRGLMRKFISGIFVGFKPTTAEQHLGALDKFLGQTELAFVERLH